MMPAEIIGAEHLFAGDSRPWIILQIAKKLELQNGHYNQFALRPSAGGKLLEVIDICAIEDFVIVPAECPPTRRRCSNPSIGLGELLRALIEAR
jgi:hypothetical protein